MITTLDPRTALILIDLQTGITARPTAPHPVATVLQNAAHLIDAFHAAAQPVIIVNVVPSADPARTKLRVEKPLGAMGQIPPNFSDIVPEIKSKTRPTDLHITKRTWSAFWNTPLHAELQKRSITQLVLAGISTSIGVEATARAANELAYNQAFVTDAMTDSDATAHTHTLQTIFPRLGEQGTTAELLAKLAAIR